MIQTTEWYPPDIKPAYEGWYERDHGADDFAEAVSRRVWFSYWTGDTWLISVPNPTPCGLKSFYQELPWRGVHMNNTVDGIIASIENHRILLQSHIAHGHLDVAYKHAAELQDLAFQLKNIIFMEDRKSGEVKDGRD